ncbi:uncharacterized protein LOC107879617 [Capsicum annuum]|uniref:uncharacterized protein LOC107879617 n=1 Tax=Capsicum annuum TaxID=4072 RepID=UPI0007BF8F02|nr:uncharacterized protein LOC107879617 [Capsicum annuum]XP_047251267.1 uncharacterized protein LOC107879617 [Capsicum annuum]
MKDPCTKNLEFVRAPLLSSYTGSTVKEIAKAYAPDIHTVRVDNNSEAVEMTQAKESSKGLKRLLRFGKKNHNSAGAESNGASMNNIKQDDNATNAFMPSDGNSKKVIWASHSSHQKAKCEGKEASILYLLWNC